MPSLIFLMAVLFIFFVAVGQELSSVGQEAWLELRLTQDNSLLYRIPLTESQNWEMRWNHSVTGNTISDYYSFTDGVMRLSQSHTPAFDAGLGYIAGRGRLESDDNHGYWIRDINEPVKDNHYILRVGSMAVNHRIIFLDDVYSLSEKAAGKRVKVAVVVEEDEK